MSATITLYEIAKDVNFISGPYFDLKPSQITNELSERSSEICRNILNEATEIFGRYDTEEKDAWIKEEESKKDPLYFGRFSDNKDHTMLMLSRNKGKKKHARNRKYSNYMQSIEKNFCDYIQSGRGKYDSQKFLILDTILYSQGWFFNKKLFKAETSTYMAFNKYMAKVLISTFIDLSKDGGKEAYIRFMEKVESYGDSDRFILKIAW